MDGKYYIYFHIDPRDSLPKYVGKGSGMRAWEMSTRRRNPKHMNWVNCLKKQGFEPVVIIGNRFHSESECFDAEIKDIAFFRKIGIDLKNIADGGEGGINTPEIVKKRAIGHYKPVRCINTGKEYPSIKHCAKDLSIDPRRITDVLKGRKKHYKLLKFEYVR